MPCTWSFAKNMIKSKATCPQLESTACTVHLLTNASQRLAEVTSLAPGVTNTPAFAAQASSPIGLTGALQVAQASGPIGSLPLVQT